ncbi:MAG: DUF2752 domain-containing protein [Clostridia bacterium]|nr:DUF2752 domain-containing protein [Clostridia bacterium]
MRKIKGWHFKLGFFILVLGGAVALYFSGVRCVWDYLFGIECPGCGMTRAYLALFRLDFKSAFEHHPMFWSVPIIFLCILFDGKIFKNKVLNYLLISAIGCGFLINYILRII